MAITGKLNELWGEGDVTDAVFEFRDAFENAYNVIAGTIEKLNKLVEDNDFSNIDAEILAEGATCQEALEAAALILNDHTDFIIWRKP